MAAVASSLISRDFPRHRKQQQQHFLCDDNDTIFLVLLMQLPITPKIYPQISNSLCCKICPQKWEPKKTHAELNIMLAK
jgi:hypothetical protein